MLIFSLIGIMLFMTAGYAAFSTNLSITAKGNIYDMSENCFSTSDNGDGSYIPPMPNVKKIKAYAFRDLSHLNLTLPPTLTTIEDSAFAWCYNINITIPESVTYISPSAFRYSTGTININKSENSIEGAPWGGDNITVNWQTKTTN